MAGWLCPAAGQFHVLTILHLSSAKPAISQRPEIYQPWPGSANSRQCSISYFSRLCPHDGSKF